MNKGYYSCLGVATYISKERNTIDSLKEKINELKTQMTQIEDFNISEETKNLVKTELQMKINVAKMEMHDLIDAL